MSGLLKAFARRRPGAAAKPRDGAGAAHSWRAPAPLGRRAAVVLANRAVGAYRVLVVADQQRPPVPPGAGQFYMLAALERWGAGEDERPFLPRAFSVLRARPHLDQAAGAGEALAILQRADDHDAAAPLQLEFLVDDVGPGTRRLAQLAAGERIWLTGPLGVGFAAPDEGRGALLVGGGVGIAPLAILQDELLAAGAPAPALLGFRDRAHAPGARLLRDVSLVTDDGSAGRAGVVTELLAERLESERDVVVYACGPPAMLEAVRALCAARDVPAQLALEAPMACGFGACMGCVVPTRSGYTRICVDGPVLEAAALAAVHEPGDEIEPMPPPAPESAAPATAASARDNGERPRLPASERRHAERRPTTDLPIGFCGLQLAHPVINASGTFDAVAAQAAFGDALLDEFPFSAFVSKTITLAPRAGNPPPRLWEAAAGMLNSIGLPNKGLAGYLETDLPRLARLPVPLITNVMGATADDVAALVEAIDERAEVAAIELNVSCPNVETGLDIGADPGQLERLVRRLRPLTPKPLIVKLTPNVADVGDVARAAEQAGADAVSLVNTLRAAALSPHAPDRPWLGGGSGGLSGPAIRAVALAQIAAVAARVAIPIVGMGGVASGRHAREMIGAGATLVAVGTESFRDPLAARRVARELAAAGD